MILAAPADAHAEVARPDPAADATGAALMIPPWIVAVELEERAVVVRDPRGESTIRLSRPLYELFRRFALPAWVDEVVGPGAPEARAHVLGLVRQLEGRGFLASPASLVPRAGGGG